MFTVANVLSGDSNYPNNMAVNRIVPHWLSFLTFSVVVAE